MNDIALATEVRSDENAEEEQQKDRDARTKQIVGDFEYFKREVTECLTAIEWQNSF